ncbi:MAG: VCBS domain-containing protein, partial [Bacteroidota bacterium]
METRTISGAAIRICANGGALLLTAGGAVGGYFLGSNWASGPLMSRFGQTFSVYAFTAAGALAGATAGHLLRTASGVGTVRLRTEDGSRTLTADEVETIIEEMKTCELRNDELVVRLHDTRGEVQTLRLEMEGMEAELEALRAIHAEQRRSDEEVGGDGQGTAEA